MHECQETCLKNQKSKSRHHMQQELGKSKVPTCRFWFFHVVTLVVFTGTRSREKRVRRRGKALVPDATIATTDVHNELGRVLPRREHPFIGSSNDVCLACARGNVDVQFLPRAPVLPDPAEADASLMPDPGEGAAQSVGGAAQGRAPGHCCDPAEHPLLVSKT